MELSATKFDDQIANSFLNFTFHRDPRGETWPLSGNPPLIGSILLAYVYVVKTWGPNFMKGREPFNLKSVIMVYNLLMVLLNVYFFYNFSTRTYLGGGYSWLCQGIDFATDTQSIELINLCWWYLLVRMLDFADTVFFLLRKKYNHISFLHVAHHCLVVFNGWFGLTYGPDGQVMLCVCLNCFVHIVMYTYYFLSLLGPSVQKYLWWKKYLTMLQLIQFVTFFAHSMVPLFYECGYPRPHTFIMVSESVFFFCMFMNFYFKAYLSKNKGHAIRHGASQRQGVKNATTNGTHLKVR